jgi:hypothetical protein
MSLDKWSIVKETEVPSFARALESHLVRSIGDEQTVFRKDARRAPDKRKIRAVKLARLSYHHLSSQTPA